jgi:hypothetical protein
MYHLEDVRASAAMRLEAFSDTFPLWLTVKPGTYEAVTDLERPILSVMNVRFALLDVSTPIPPGWHDRGFDVYTRLIENDHVLPRAFVPRVVRLGVDRSHEIEEMRLQTDFMERAWLDIPERRQERANGPGRAVSRWRGSTLHLDATMEAAGFVVISQAAWKGWRAYLDGHRVSVHGANHAFLAVYVPAGRHEVILRFLPQSFVVGRMITFTTIALLMLIGVARAWIFRHRDQEKPQSLA